MKKFIFDSRAKRFPQAIDEIFERKYANPGPGQYNPENKNIASLSQHDRWKIQHKAKL
jgi:hypothetical protein